MFKSDIKEVAGLPILVGEPVIVDLHQTLEGMTVEQYGIINIAKIILPLQVGAYKTEVVFWHTTRSEVAYKLIDKCPDTKAVVSQLDALNLFGSTHGIASQGWNYKKQCEEIYTGLLQELEVSLDTDQVEQLGRLIKEAAAYSTQNLIEKDLTNLTYQCEDLNGGIIIKKYHELDDYEIIWDGLTEDRISNVFKESMTRKSVIFAAALTKQSLEAIEVQLSLINSEEVDAHKDYVDASKAVGIAAQKHEAHTRLLSQPTTNKSSIFMQRASLAVGTAYIDAKVWKERAKAALRLNKAINNKLSKKRDARVRFLESLSNSRSG